MMNKLIEKYEEILQIIEKEFKIKLYKNYMKQLTLQSQLDIANKKLEEMKKSQLETLNETRKYLNSKKATPEMVAIALRKIEISILGE